MDRGPIFIGGLDRSGKTLLRLMLSSHPNIAMTRRSYMWTDFYKRFGDLSNRVNFERCLAAMLRHKSMRFLEPDIDRIRREFWQGEPTYARLFGLFHLHHAEKLGKTRWGDQLASIERYANPILLAFPSAKIIHIMRDPRERYIDSNKSLSRRRGKAGWEAARWLSSALLAKRNLRHFPENYMVIRYEDFISRPEQTLRDVCSFIGECFEPSMLTMEGAERFGEQDANNLPKNSKSDMISGGESGRSTRLIRKREIAILQAFAKQEMATNGYLLEQPRFSLAEWCVYYLVDWPMNLLGFTAWRLFDARQPV